MTQPSKYPNAFYRVSLKAIIRNAQGEVLITKENSDTFDLPGGGWDHGETAHEALARELQEELGFTGSFTMKHLANTTFYLPEKQAWLLWIVYEVTPEQTLVLPKTPELETKFVSPSSLASATDPFQKWMYDNL